MKNVLLKAWPHAFAVLVFAIIASVYFSPTFEGYDLAQHDIEGWTGMAKESTDYRLLHDEEPLWTNSMFGGMPTQLISIIYPGNFYPAIDRIAKLGLPRPVGSLFMAMLGFYILCMCMGIRWYFALPGAIGFGLTTFNILFLGAGHTSKISAVGYMAPALGGLILAYRKNILLGASVFALFFGLHIASNHLQITYYFSFLLGLVWLGELVRSLKEKESARFARATAVMAFAFIISILPNAGSLLGTYEYSKYSMRGESILTIDAQGETLAASKKSGLDKDYILQYSLGTGEVLSLFIPDVKGGKSARIGSEKELLQSVPNEYREAVGNSNRYWGEQLGTGGAFYFGAVIMFLFLLGILFVRDFIKWPLLVVAVLAVFLCQKDNGINNWFIDHFPMYNKFRDTKMILTLFTIAAPLMAVLFLEWLSDVSDRKKIRKWLLGSMGGIVLIFGLITAMPKAFFDFKSSSETQEFADYIDQLAPGSKEMTFVEGILENLEKVRVEIFTADSARTLMLMVLTAVIVALAFYKKAKMQVIVPVLTLVILADMWTVDRRYLNNDRTRGSYASYVRHDDKVMPYHPSFSDQFILSSERSNSPTFDKTKEDLLSAMKASSLYSGVRDKNLMDSIAAFGSLNLTTDFRVLNLQGTFTDASSSYFHKTVGGYHAAKLKRYQDMITFHISQEISTMIDSLKKNNINVFSQLPVLNMLNAKYVIYNPGSPPIMNTEALGAAWFVNEVRQMQSPDEEIQTLSSIDPKVTALVSPAFAPFVTSGTMSDSTATIVLEEYGTRYLRYKSSCATEATAVFSEVYYPDGWKCSIDGAETEFACVDYVLRGVKVPAGERTIEWTFAPESYYQGNTLGYVGSSLLLLFLLFSAFMEIKKKKVEIIK